MNKKTPAILFILNFLLLGSAFSQDFNPPAPAPAGDKKEPFWSWEKVYLGGDGGLWFDKYSSYVNISPMIGYKITKRYSAGIGAKYIYLEDRSYGTKSTLSIYGGSIFNRFLVTDFLFLHGEYEILNGPWSPYTDKRYNLNNVWVGGGLRQVSGNASINIMGLWNLNVEPFNPFPNPQIRIGVSVGM